MHFQYVCRVFVLDVFSSFIPCWRRRRRCETCSIKGALYSNVSEIENASDWGRRHNPGSLPSPLHNAYTTNVCDELNFFWSGFTKTVFQLYVYRLFIEGCKLREKKICGLVFWFYHLSTIITRFLCMWFAFFLFIFLL